MDASKERQTPTALQGQSGRRAKGRGGDRHGHCANIHLRLGEVHCLSCSTYAHAFKHRYKFFDTRTFCLCPFTNAARIPIAGDHCPRSFRLQMPLAASVTI
jgi:hypothetical protein